MSTEQLIAPEVSLLPTLPAQLPLPKFQLDQAGISAKSLQETSDVWLATCMLLALRYRRLNTITCSYSAPKAIRARNWAFGVTELL
jgi:hypothetical protein